MLLGLPKNTEKNLSYDWSRTNNIFNMLLVQQLPKISANIYDMGVVQQLPKTSANIYDLLLPKKYLIFSGCADLCQAFARATKGTAVSVEGGGFFSSHVLILLR